MRNSSIELLRIVAMFSIVVGHVFYHGFHGEFAESDVLRPFTNCGVNIFIMISGYFGIKFKWRSLFDLLMMVSFYTLLSGLAAYFIFGESLSLRQMSGVFLPFSGNHYYWFMTCYIILFIFAPILNEGIDGLFRNKNIKFTPPVLIFINCIGGWLIGNNLINDNGYNVMHFFSLYIIARCIRLYDIPQRYKQSTLLIAYIFLFILIGYIGYAYWPKIYYRNSIFMIAISTIMLCLFLKITIVSSIINRIAKSMLAVYLIQEGIIGISLYSLVYKFYNEKSYIMIFIYIIGLFLAAYLIEYPRRYISDKVYSYISNKFNVIKDVQ